MIFGTVFVMKTVCVCVCVSNHYLLQIAHQPGMAASPSRQVASVLAVPSRVSLSFSTPRLNLVLNYGLLCYLPLSATAI